MQRETVAAIERDGGKVWYDWEWADGESSSGASPNAPAWFVRALGVDYFGHVAAVYLPRRAGDEALALVARLDRLESLEISGSHLSAKGFAHVGELKHLRNFALHRTELDDGAPRHSNR